MYTCVRKQITKKVALKSWQLPSMVAHFFNPSTLEAEADNHSELTVSQAFTMSSRPQNAQQMSLMACYFV